MHLHEVFGRLASRGHRVTLLTSGWPGAPDRTELDGIDVHRVGSRFTVGVKAPRYFRRHLRDRHWDVVVEDLNKVPFFSPLWVDSPIALLVHHLFGTVAFREASFPVALATWLLELGVPRAFRTVPTIAVSESTAEDLVRRGMSRRSISVIHNGIDPARFAPAGLRGRFEEPSLLYLGRLKRYKRVDMPIRAVAVLRDRGVFVRLRIAGKGDHGPALERLVRRLGVEDRVTFEGYVSDERRLELLQRSWVHVLTSPKEGWGIVNMEAAACGTPTVASDSPGLRDSVRDGRTGLLVPHGRIEALVGAIRALVEDPALRARMSEEAVGFARVSTWDHAAESVESFLFTRVATRSRRL